MSMHKLTAGDGYAYFTRHFAAGDAGLEAGASLTAYYEQTDNPTTGAVSASGVRLNGGLAAGAGDRVVTRRNDRRLGTSDGFVRNGALWDVTEVLPDGALVARPAAGSPGPLADASTAASRPPPSPGTWS